MEKIEAINFVLKQDDSTKREIMLALNSPQIYIEKAKNILLKIRENNTFEHYRDFDYKWVAKKAKVVKALNKYGLVGRF